MARSSDAGCTRGEGTEGTVEVERATNLTLKGIDLAPSLDSGLLFLGKVDGHDRGGCKET